MNLQELFVGLDAEFFFMKDEKVLPAHHLLPSKETPLAVSSDRKGAVNPEGPGILFHYDGIQAEFGVAESRDLRQIMARVHEAIKFAENLARENLAKISLEGSVPVDPTEFPTYPLDAVAFGCDVDFISWLDGMPNSLTCDADSHEVRYAGTHLHLGAPIEGSEELARTLLEPITKMEVIKVMDYLVGNTAVLLDQSPGSKKRRELYGKAGTFRPTDYGVEYRVLSSFLLVSPHWLPFFWTLAKESVRIVAEERQFELFDALSPKDIIKAIDNNNYKQAEKNWKKVRGFCSGTWDNPLLSEQVLNHFERVAEAGLSNLFPDTLGANWMNNSIDLVTDAPRIFQTKK